MKKKNSVVLFILISIFIFTANVQASTVFTTYGYIEIDQYYYQLWKDMGDTTMTIDDDGSFSCEWQDINNALFRKGRKLDIENSYRELDNITVEYDCDYQPEGISYLAVYGMKEVENSEILEYYIVESWGTWKPYSSMESLGTITVDGATYDIYKTINRVPMGSILDKRVNQYWSVRSSKRTSGKVSVIEHFKAWESLGLNMWDMDQVAFMVEGVQSSGRADVKSVTISINETDTPAEEFIIGDINGDGNTNSIDFGMLRKYLLGLIDSFEYEYGLEAADINGDGNINSIDFGVYRKYLLGMITELTI